MRRYMEYICLSEFRLFHLVRTKFSWKLFFIVDVFLIVFVDCVFSIHSCTDGQQANSITWLSWVVPQQRCAQLSTLCAEFGPFGYKKGITGSCMVSIFVFWRHSKLDSIVVVLIYIPVNVQCLKILYLPHPCKLLMFILLWILFPFEIATLFLVR